MIWDGLNKRVFNKRDFEALAAADLERAWGFS
jgi:hypothetical protein